MDLRAFRTVADDYIAAIRRRRKVPNTLPEHALCKLGRPRLLAADDVVALDPAAGTGTYLLGLLGETRDRLRAAGFEAGLPAHLRRAARRLHGFELLVGPYTVASQRVAAWLRKEKVADERPRVHLTDTLLPPGALRHEQQQLGVFVQDLAREREAADEVKRSGEVVVVIGNPQYDRGRARPADDWLQQQMRSFSDPVQRGERVNLKNLSDPYVYFMRWALWKLFEAPDLSAGPRVLSFITNRSYLSGGAFEGLRLRLRELWNWSRRCLVEQLSTVFLGHRRVHQRSQLVQYLAASRTDHELSDVLDIRRVAARLLGAH